jgi:hypothetical protein
MLDGRHADSARRRQRVLTALDQAAAEGAGISASGIARAARVDRTFLYRNRDLLEKIHALQAEPAPGDGAGPAVTRASLQADLLAAHERAVRLNTRILIVVVLSRDNAHIVASSHQMQLAADVISGRDFSISPGPQVSGPRLSGSR